MVTKQAPLPTSGAAPKDYVTPYQTHRPLQPSMDGGRRHRCQTSPLSPISTPGPPPSPTTPPSLASLIPTLTPASSPFSLQRRTKSLHWVIYILCTINFLFMDDLLDYMGKDMDDLLDYDHN